MVENNSLFSTLRLRDAVLKNRIVFGAHTANMAEDGYPGARHIGYYEERAMGGAAMIVVEPIPVHDTAVLTRGNFRHNDDSVIPAFSDLVQRCKAHDCVMVQQLYHVGQHGDADLSYAPNWSPSGLPSYHDSDGSHAMTPSEIEEVIEGFKKAALRCQKAGFDGVEIWAAYHSLIDQFWTPWSNHRDDEWGGSLENRMRLSTRILETVRGACGPDFIVGFSFSYSEFTDFTLTLDDYLEILSIHDAQNHFDYVSCGTGNYVDYDRVMPTFVHGEKLGVPLAEAVKGRLENAAVIAESHIRTPENARYVVKSGAADLVSIVRGQIADPHLANKAKDDRDQDVRGCISCNQMCWGRRSRDYWISCLINPSAGREYEWGGDRFDRAAATKSVLVVGGGPAGLEAARVAAERGHKVILAEAASQLGGQFYLAGLTPRRGQISDLIGWYERQLRQLNVDIRYDSYFDLEDIEAIAPDHVILATGSYADDQARQRWLPQHQYLPGLENGHVWSSDAVMRGEMQLGHTVVMLDEGGSWRGMGTALSLIEKGHSVHIVTPDPYVGKDLSRTTADFPVRSQLKKAGSQFFTESVISQWTGKSAVIRDMATSQETVLGADDLVMSTTPLAFDPLSEALLSRDIPFDLIGDAQSSRPAAFAFYEGRKVARLL